MVWRRQQLAADGMARRPSVREKIAHPGTFNANPVSTAAGTAALTVIAETNASDAACTIAAELREKLNAVLAEARVPWAVSGFHLFVNTGGLDIGRATSIRRKFARGPEVSTEVNKLRLAMLANGVDLNPRGGGLLSCTHTAEDVANTTAAFRDAVHDSLAKIHDLTRGDLTRPIVVFCVNSERFTGYNAALRLAALGYTNVHWYRGGIEAWEVNNLPERELVLQAW